MEHSAHADGGLGRGQDGGGFKGGKDALDFFLNIEECLPFGDRAPWILSSTGAGPCCASSTAAHAIKKLS